MLKSGLTMTNKLMTFNAFGSVKVTANEVYVSITAITKNGRPISRVFLQEFETPLIDRLQPGEWAKASFGIFIEDNGKARIAFNEEVMTPGVDVIGNFPGVTRAIMKTVDMVKGALIE